MSQISVPNHKNNNNNENKTQEEEEEYNNNNNINNININKYIINRNRRYIKLNQLQEDGYFNLDQMRWRQPALFKTYIGYYNEKMDAERCVERGKVNKLLAAIEEETLQTRADQETKRWMDKEKCESKVNECNDTHTHTHTHTHINIHK
eukprot:GHVR01060587.1.p1 GENE.GHVR01060587.1~~GHVR01060587.1.p1  ORF type:complete len:149 (+),score=75.27 GHVR01060587.1:135-581(+)